nr:uncharacterized protein LOC107376736 isoform X2 [Nothobranchius furzeri]
MLLTRHQPSEMTLGSTTLQKMRLKLFKCFAGGRVGESQLQLISISRARGFKERHCHTSAPVGTLLLVPTLDSSLGSCLPEVCHTFNVAQLLWPPALHRSPVLDRTLLPATPLHQTISSSDLTCLPLLLKPPLRTNRS